MVMHRDGTGMRTCSIPCISLRYIKKKLIFTIWINLYQYILTFCRNSQKKFCRYKSRYIWQWWMYIFELGSLQKVAKELSIIIYKHSAFLSIDVLARTWGFLLVSQIIFVGVLIVKLDKKKMCLIELWYSSLNNWLEITVILKYFGHDIELETVHYIDV